MKTKELSFIAQGQIDLNANPEILNFAVSNLY